MWPRKWYEWRRGGYNDGRMNGGGYWIKRENDSEELMNKCLRFWRQWCIELFFSNKHLFDVTPRLSLATSLRVTIRPWPRRLRTACLWSGGRGNRGSWCGRSRRRGGRRQSNICCSSSSNNSNSSSSSSSSSNSNSSSNNSNSSSNNNNCSSFSINKKHLKPHTHRFVISIFHLWETD